MTLTVALCKGYVMPQVFQPAACVTGSPVWSKVT